jgi:hypothetical protein
MVLSRYLRLLVSLPVLFLMGCDGEKHETTTDRQTTEFVLSVGGVISDESYLQLWEPSDRDPGQTEYVYSICHNQLYFQFDGSAPREPLGGDIQTSQSPISISDGKLVYRNGERMILKVGAYIFERLVFDGKALWGSPIPETDYDRNAFLRSFLRADDRRAKTPGDFFGTPLPSWSPFRGTPYVFDHFDEKQNLLVIKRASNEAELPSFLAYSRPLPGERWALDLERTRSINGLNPPDDPHLIVDISAVTFAGELEPAEEKDRERVLAKPNAKEVFNQSTTLSATTWDKLNYSYSTPDNLVQNREFEVLFGFRDALPDYLTVIWKSRELSGTGYKFTKVGVWENVTSTRSKDGIDESIFFRVREAD